MNDLKVGPPAVMTVSHGHDQQGTPFLALKLGEHAPFALSVAAAMRLAEQITGWVMSPCAMHRVGDAPGETHKGCEMNARTVVIDRPLFSTDIKKGGDA